MPRISATHCRPAARSARRSTAIVVATLSLVLLGHGCHGDDNDNNGPPLVERTKLDANCSAKFATTLPVFGPAGSIPRVDAAAHANITVTMVETDPQGLPQGSFANIC